jgi:hypothetical protein
MSNINTGGPAFPCEWDYIGSKREAANGMTLRDYFAAKAMQALLVGEGFPLANGVPAKAYKLADAMLEARGA